MFEDAVITPYGTTYDRAAIVTALRHSREDPLTRQPLSESQLVPNRGITEAVLRYRQSVDGGAVQDTVEVASVVKCNRE